MGVIIFQLMHSEGGGGGGAATVKSYHDTVQYPTMLHLGFRK